MLEIADSVILQTFKNQSYLQTKNVWAFFYYEALKEHPAQTSIHISMYSGGETQMNLLRKRGIGKPLLWAKLLIS